MKPICPECKSQNILYRKRPNTLLCRRCGCEWDRILENKNVDKGKTRRI